MPRDNTVLGSLERAFERLLNDVAVALPDILAALVVFLVGLFIAPIFGRLAAKLVRMAHVDSLAEKVGVTKMLRDLNIHVTFADVVGTLVKWFFIIAFLIAAANILGWDEVTSFLNQILFYIPNVIVAIIILAVGLIAGNFVETLIREGLDAAKLPLQNPALLGRIAKWAIVVFASFAALTQLRIAEELVQILFAGLVLALALAFGLGGREKAARVLDSLDKSGGQRPMM